MCNLISPTWTKRMSTGHCSKNDFKHSSLSAGALSSALQHAHPSAVFLVRSIKATPKLQKHHLSLHLPSSNLTFNGTSPFSIGDTLTSSNASPTQKIIMGHHILKANSFPKPPYCLGGHENVHRCSMQNQMAHSSSTNKTLQCDMKHELPLKKKTIL